MNYFDKSLDDFRRLYPDAGRSKAANGLTGPDLAGIGLQVGGAILQDRAAEEELRRQEEKDRLAMILSGRNARSSAQQVEQGMQQSERGLNMQGAAVLAEMRSNALKNRRLYSTRRAFLGAI